MNHTGTFPGHAVEAPAARPRPRAARRHERWAWSVALVCAAALAFSDHGARRLAREISRQAAVLASLQPAARQFAAEAERLLETGDFAGARAQLRYALTLAPGDASWHCRLGDAWQSAFDFSSAAAEYRRATELDPKCAPAWDGLALCERLGRAGEAGRRVDATTLYAMHRVMVKWGRLAEAARVAQQLPGDAELQRKTWEARLRHGGLSAAIALDANGRLDITITGAAQARLGLLRGLPPCSLRLAGTDLRDLSALAGLPLEQLDLERTAVADLTPLRGMPLRTLTIARTAVGDLFPLRGMRLHDLDASHTAVRSIFPLAEMPLRRLSLAHSRVADLRALASVPLLELDLSGTPVNDIAPLAHLPLTCLRLDDTAVADLAPLRCAPLSELSLPRTPVADLTPLTKSPLAVLRLTGCARIGDLSPLAQCRQLQTLALPTQQSDVRALAALPRLRFLE